MSLTPSNMNPLGSPAPDFKLPDTQGNNISLKAITKENGVLVVFMCNHCPFVLHIAEFLEPLHQKLAEIGIGMVAINANDAAEYPADSPEKMLAFAEQSGFSFPYLFDKTQAVARSYDAACTPDFFLYDDDLKLFYRGQLDASRPNNGVPVTGEDLLAAASALANGSEYTAEQKPSIGCNIKWKD